MQTVLMPTEYNDEFVVDVTYEGGSQLRARSDKLKNAVEEAEGMATFGLVVIARSVLRNTHRLIKQDGMYMRVFEVLV